MAIWAAAWPQKSSAGIEDATAATPRRYMPGAPEIYFHKLIDNSRLVRTADPVRKREMQVFAVALAGFFFMVLLYLGQHCSSIEYGYRIEDLRAKREALAEVNRTLQLEKATLRDPKRIHDLAIEQGLSLPTVGQVQRLDPATPAAEAAPVMARASEPSPTSSMPY